MNLMLIPIGATLLFAMIIGVLIVIVAKPVRQGRVSPGAAKLLGLFAALVIIGVFVLIMGVLKGLQ
ncbi:MAG: hypothetical protein LBU77_02470 [Clostridiales bacterium]|jgi:hypothetical protein|nr:hypothetical protein [Clostridiales bacterium]